MSQVLLDSFDLHYFNNENNEKSLNISESSNNMMWLTCYKVHSKCLTKLCSEIGYIGGVQKKKKTKTKEQRKGYYNNVSKNDDNWTITIVVGWWKVVEFCINWKIEPTELEIHFSKVFSYSSLAGIRISHFYFCSLQNVF